MYTRGCGIFDVGHRTSDLVIVASHQGLIVEGWNHVEDRCQDRDAIGVVDVGEFKLLRSHMGVADEAKNYSPGNLRAVTTNAQYAAAVEGWMADEKTLRYSGCMVADIHHILSKGQGIFSNIGGGEDSKYPDGKLRHVFECGPFAYLVEEAGGLSSDGVQSILDKKITDVDQRTAIIIGSKNEVEKTVGILSA